MPPSSRWVFPSRVLASLTIQTPKSRMIEIVRYRPEWPAKYQRLGEIIRANVGDAIVALHHIGSTAVPGLAAKDVIDIQITVADLASPMSMSMSNFSTPLHGTHKPCMRQPKPTNSPSVGGYAGGFMGLAVKPRVSLWGCAAVCCGGLPCPCCTGRPRHRRSGTHRSGRGYALPQSAAEGGHHRPTYHGEAWAPSSPPLRRQVSLAIERALEPGGDGQNFHRRRHLDAGH